MATPLLLADDSPTIAKILQMALQNEPYEIRAVLTAEDALKELRANPPYFFLVDLSLPTTNGYEFARLIKKDPKLRSVRVILLASAFEPVDDAEYASCGADGLVKKPFDPAELRNKLRSIVDAPPKFPDGAKVTGSLSGFMVTTPEDPSGSISLPASDPDPLAGLLQGGSPAPAESDADAILAGLLGGGSPEAPPAAPSGSVAAELALSLGGADTPPAAPAAEAPRAGTGTIAVDFNALKNEPAPSADENVLDLSGNFDAGGNTAMIDFSGVGERTSAQILNPTPEPATSAAPSATEGLSANAQALAAFFEAEINAKAPAAPAPAPSASLGKPAKVEEVPADPESAPADPFDASLGSIDWDAGPAEASLSQWSSNQPKGKPAAPSSFDAPPPFSRKESPATQTKIPSGATTPGFAPQPAARSAAPSASKPASSGGGGGASGNMLFDTGGSTFRFSEDYVNRITKAFTGAPEEAVPEQHAMFPQHSDDRRPQAPVPAEEASSGPTAGPGGGAWSEKDVQMIEKIVREEVQMVVREVAEKIAWEVIPELAENLIRKELDKVLKEMEQ